MIGKGWLWITLQLKRRLINGVFQDVEYRVEGVIKKANLWLIPIQVEKPLDKRKIRYCGNE